MSIQVTSCDVNVMFLYSARILHHGSPSCRRATVRHVSCGAHVSQMAARGLVCLCRSVCATASPRQANTNEAHSFPRAGIWHAVVLRHSATTGAICWHILSFSHTGGKQDSSTRARQWARSVSLPTHLHHLTITLGSLLSIDYMLSCWFWKNVTVNTIRAIIYVIDLFCNAGRHSLSLVFSDYPDHLGLDF